MFERKPILIGYWLGPLSPDWPDVREFVDPTWDATEREAVIAHLRNGKPYLESWGISNCRFCCAHNGSSELTDRIYFWPEGLAHYLEKHRVRLPQRFVEHVLRGPSRPSKSESELVGFPSDEAWWRRQEWRNGSRRSGLDRSLEQSLEIVRQVLALARFYGHGGAPRFQRLGKAGDYLLQAAEEAQLEHEARFGPPAHHPHPPQVNRSN